MRYAKLIFALVLLTVVLILVLENSSPVTLKFLFWKTPEVSLAVIASGFFVLGIVFAVVIQFLLRMKKSRADRFRTKQPQAERQVPSSGNQNPPVKANQRVGKDNHE